MNDFNLNLYAVICIIWLLILLLPMKFITLSIKIGCQLFGHDYEKNKIYKQWRKIIERMGDWILAPFFN